MDAIRHGLAALRVGVLSAIARPRHVLLVVAGLLIASFTLLVILTIPAGLERIAGRTGLDDVAVVLAGTSIDETDGDIAPELLARIGALPGVARKPDGAPRLAPQFVVTTKLQRRDGGMGTLLLRGMTPDIWDVAGASAKLVQGQAPKPGITEIAAGRQLAQQYPFTATGAALALSRNSPSEWKVTGQFAASGGLWESELWADIDSVRSEFNANGQTTSVWVKLESPAAWDVFVAGMQADPRLRGFRVVRQKGLYALRVGFLASFVNAAAWAVAILLGVMAVLAGNSAVGLMLRARRREIAMLRSIGFENHGLLLALLVEVLLLAVLASLIAIVIAWCVVNAQDINSASGELSIRFAMQVTPRVVALALGYTALLGVFGALLPAWRSLRAPLVTALAWE